MLFPIYPCFPGCAKISPNPEPIFDRCLEMAAEAAPRLDIFNTTPVVKLLKEDGRIVGVVAKTVEGEYIKAIAHNGVVLATGDFFSNKLMVNAFLSRRYPDGCKTLNTLKDFYGEPCNMGDGHRMGVWAGAKVQLDGVNMSHKIGRAQV